jgi:hypothetical protein
MKRKISWIKGDLERYASEKSFKYVFYEDNIEIGFFQVKGIIGQRRFGKLNEKEITFGWVNIPKNGYFSTYTSYPAILDTKTKEYIAKIEEKTIIGRWLKITEKRVITTKDNKEYIIEITTSNNITVAKDNDELLSCQYKNSSEGEIIITSILDDAIILGIFYIIHNFMELKESP